MVRDLKIIEGGKGVFIAMPSRKLSDRCHHCGGKNHLRAAYCNTCGGRLDADRAGEDERGRARLHADLAHPINSECRTELHRCIVRAMEAEIERSKEAGYVPPTFDDLDEAEDFFDDRDVADYAAPGRRGAAGERERAREQGA